MTQNSNDRLLLIHYGIRGMRWGIRNNRNTSRKDKTEKSSDYKNARILEKRGPKKLSNEELTALNKRLNLEQTYRKAKLDKHPYKRGLNFVQAITAGGTAVAALYGLSRTPLYKDVKLAIELHSIQQSAKVAKIVEDFVI